MWKLILASQGKILLKITKESRQQLLIFLLYCFGLKIQHLR